MAVEKGTEIQMVQEVGVDGRLPVLLVILVLLVEILAVAPDLIAVTLVQQRHLEAVEALVMQDPVVAVVLLYGEAEEAEEVMGAIITPHKVGIHYLAQEEEVRADLLILQMSGIIPTREEDMEIIQLEMVGLPELTGRAVRAVRELPEAVPGNLVMEVGAEDTILQAQEAMVEMAEFPEVRAGVEAEDGTLVVMAEQEQEEK